MTKKALPFIYGAQYFRDPTPDKRYWDRDMAHMREIGFDSIKFWAQWRWIQREKDSFYFDTLDELMDLAEKHGLEVTINTIFDVTPLWLFERYPDARVVLPNGLAVQTQANPCRQGGGVPAPCYCHSQALTERKKFMRAVLEHLAPHPAFKMLDVWNEPAQNMVARNPDPATLTCYCDNCHAGLIEYLKTKYGTLDQLNEVWGRCYSKWDQVEIPRDSSACFSDFIDWREFKLDVMTAEAKWRLEMVKEYAPAQLGYLHVVPSTIRIFNAVTCVDDFALSEISGDVWAGTTVLGEHCKVQLKSTARGKVIYNAESHINAGQCVLHPKQIDYRELCNDFIAQIAQGIRGFLFWQFRPEALGGEAPAWGVIRPDGSNRPVTHAAKKFIEKLAPYKVRLMNAYAPDPHIAVWKSRKNELYQFAAYRNLDNYAESIDSYTDALHALNYNFVFIDHKILTEQMLKGIKFLIMPSPYCLTRGEADALDKWVSNGGTVLCEAHLGAYNADSGRYSENVPGHELAAKWDIKEIESTAAVHLPQSFGPGGLSAALTDDVKKALSGGGGEFFQIETSHGAITGCSRVAFLECKDGEVLGSLPSGEAIIASKPYGNGRIIYVGTELGRGSTQACTPFLDFLQRLLAESSIDANLGALGSPVRVDAIGGKPESPDFISIVNTSDVEQEITLTGDGDYKGVFTDKALSLQTKTTLCVTGKDAELFVNKKEI